MLGGEQKADRMIGLLQKGHASLLILQDALLTLDPQGLGKAKLTGHPADQTGRFVGIELIQEEDHLLVGLQLTYLFLDQHPEVLFGTCGTYRMVQQPTGGHVNAGNQR